MKERDRIDKLAAWIKVESSLAGHAPSEDLRAWVSNPGIAQAGGVIKKRRERGGTANCSNYTNGREFG